MEQTSREVVIGVMNRYGNLIPSVELKMSLAHEIIDELYGRGFIDTDDQPSYIEDVKTEVAEGIDFESKYTTAKAEPDSIEDTIQSIQEKKNVVQAPSKLDKLHKNKVKEVSAESFKKSVNPTIDTDKDTKPNKPKKQKKKSSWIGE